MTPKMTYDQGTIADIMLWLITAFLFGVWQDSIAAGCFMWAILIIWKGYSK